MGGMTYLSIGDFSRMTYLSVKALRHYHDVGVLTPAEVDPSSGYRFYAPSQVGLAQMIRRLRDLGMPLEEVRTIVLAPDAASRDEALVAHLRRMEAQLEATQQTVASLRTLLEGPDETFPVTERDIAATPALAIREHVKGEDAVAWWMAAFGLLHQTLRDAGGTRAGADGGCSRRSSSPTRKVRSPSSYRSRSSRAEPCPTGFSPPSFPRSGRR